MVDAAIRGGIGGTNDEVFGRPFARGVAGIGLLLRAFEMVFNTKVHRYHPDGFVIQCRDQ